MNDDYQRDLPVLLRTDDLPIPAPDAAPQPQPATPCYFHWGNWASQCHIRTVAIDPIQGDIWLATGGGILRWTARLDRFTRYTSEHGLPGNSIRSIAVDGSGRVWAVHDSVGISYFNGDSWQPYLNLSNVTVSCLTIDQAGQLWIGTGQGIYGISSSTDDTVIVDLPLHSPPPRSLAITAENDLWLCNAQGIFHFQETWKRYIAQPNVLTLARQGNNLWIGTTDGLTRLDLLTQQTYPSGELRTEVSALAATPEGVWAACGKQVGFATDTTWTPVGGKAIDCVTSLSPADDNSVWIGTHNGLQYANSISIRFQLTDAPPDVIGIRSPTDPPTTFSNLVQSLAIQSTQDRTVLWAGTARGLFRIDLSTGIWRRLGQFGKQDVRTVAASQSGQTIWAAGWICGLYSSQQSNLTAVPEVAGPITTLVAGLEGHCWVGGLAGVYQRNGASWTLTLPAKKLPGKAWVRTIAQLTSEELWIGTSAGLYLYSLKTKILTPVAGSLGSAPTHSLLATPTSKPDSLWIGTDRGLYVGQPSDPQSVKGLENRAITALSADLKHQRIWVGTDKGLLSLINSESTCEVETEFTVENSGLAHNRILALTLDTSLPNQSRLWIGTPCGLSFYLYDSG